MKIIENFDETLKENFSVLMRKSMADVIFLFENLNFNDTLLL